jgi:hypothetical protein
MTNTLLRARVARARARKPLFAHKNRAESGENGEQRARALARGRSTCAESESAHTIRSRVTPICNSNKDPLK